MKPFHIQLFDSLDKRYVGPVYVVYSTDPDSTKDSFTADWERSLSFVVKEHPEDWSIPDIIINLPRYWVLEELEITEIKF